MVAIDWTPDMKRTCVDFEIVCTVSYLVTIDLVGWINLACNGIGSG